MKPSSTAKAVASLKYAAIATSPTTISSIGNTTVATTTTLNTTELEEEGGLVQIDEDSHVYIGSFSDYQHHHQHDNNRKISVVITSPPTIAILTPAEVITFFFFLIDLLFHFLSHTHHFISSSHSSSFSLTLHLSLRLLKKPINSSKPLSVVNSKPYGTSLLPILKL